MHSLLSTGLITTLISMTAASPLQSSTQMSAQYTSDTIFKSSMLNLTNTYRQQHNASGLAWNETLAKYAGDYGEDCKFEHSDGPYGENLASGYANVSQGVIGWGQERTKYDFKKGTFSTETGHFTQLVWKSTTTVGCSRNACNGGEQGGKGDAPGWYVVCEYWPRGNVIGSFVQNVQKAVPKDQQPQGPSDPEVPTAGAVKVSRGALSSGLVAILWVGLWVL